jgi:hypothetical protein
VPVLKLKRPLVPAAPALTVDSTRLPEDFALPMPLLKLIAPPVWSAEMPVAMMK